MGSLVFRSCKIDSGGMRGARVGGEGAGLQDTDMSASIAASLTASSARLPRLGEPTGDTQPTSTKGTLLLTPSMSAPGKSLHS